MHDNKHMLSKQCKHFEAKPFIQTSATADHISLGVQTTRLVCLHHPGVTEERPKQKFQLGIVLPLGMMGPVSIPALQGFPTVDYVNIGLTHFLFQSAHIQKPLQCAIHLDSFSHCLLVRYQRREQFLVSIEKFLQDFEKRVVHGSMREDVPSQI
jgi:hypothetical protein